MTSTERPPPDTPGASGAIERAADDRILLGVCGGVAHALRVDTTLVRAAFIVAAALGGVGVGLYAAAAVALPRPTRPVSASPARAQTATAVAMLLGALLVLVDRLGLLLPFGLLWPATLILGGLGLVWRYAGGRVVAPVAGTWARPALVEALRAAGALALILGGGAVLLAQTGGFAGAAAVAVTASVIAAGVALLLGPRVARARREADAERAERVIAEERVAVAARLHDSVLQTLALIQRKAGDPRAVVALARAQERDLRSWLFGDDASPGSSLRAALDAVAAEVEAAHGVPVEVVLVGDAPLDDGLTALVRATREATLNAARHSGAPVVDVYAEVDRRQVEVFVRDRGVGFDPGAVPADRLGLKGSVIGRVERHGGTASVRTAPGEGTEVHLTMDLGTEATVDQERVRDEG